MRHAVVPVLAAALLAIAPLAGGEPAVTVKQVELRQNPAADAKSLLTVPAETTVDLVKREGAWVQLKSGKVTGWAKLFDIRLPGAGAAAAKGGGTGGIAQTLNLAAGNRGASVTTGVRGLDAEMLTKATPNAQEFAVLVGYAATREQAQAFAKAGKLETRVVEPLK
jgi:hypothetical protein